MYRTIKFCIGYCNSSLVPTLTPSSINVCPGNSVVLTASSGFSSYQFFANNISLGAPQASPVLTTTPTVSPTTYTVTVTNGQGCTGTSTGVAVTVNAHPIPTFTVTPSPVCQGSSVTLTAQQGFGTYQFFANGVALTGVQPSNTLVTTPLTSPTVYTVVVDTATCPGLSAPISVNILPLPTPTLTASATGICKGGTVTLTATAGFATYQFLANGAPLGGPQASNVITDTPQINTTYSVVVTDSNGCMGTSNVVSVTTGTPIIVTLTSSSSATCLGQSVTLTALPAGQGSYQFFANGGPLGPVQTSNTFVTVPTANPTVYTAQIVIAGCASISNPVTVTPGLCSVLSLDYCCSKTVPPHSTTTLFITVKNVGAAPATNVVVTDVFPSCIDLLLAGGPGWTVTQTLHSLQATLPVLGVGQSATLALRVRVNCPRGSINESTATVTSDADPISESIFIKVCN